MALPISERHRHPLACLFNSYYQNKTDESVLPGFDVISKGTSDRLLGNKLLQYIITIIIIAVIIIINKSTSLLMDQGTDD